MPTNLDFSFFLEPEEPASSRDRAAFRGFIRQIEAAADAVGFPFFLRTGLTSNKHQWRRTCYVEKPEEIGSHVLNLIEFSGTADMLGLPTNIWAVRELLPVEPVAILPRYHDMPLVKEARVFIRDGKIQCAHLYWPMEAIAEGLPYVEGIESSPLDDLPLDLATAVKHFELASDINWDHVLDLAHKVADVFPEGYWSVDLLDTKRGWFVTDMAEGDRSFHYPGCDKVKGKS